MTGMEYMAVSADELSDWATDSNGWALTAALQTLVGLQAKTKMATCT